MHEELPDAQANMLDASIQMLHNLYWHFNNQAWHDQAYNQKQTLKITVVV